jgi:hypothetical protein
MKRTKAKPRKMYDQITGYLLQIAGDEQQAQRAADMWGVRIRTVEILPDRNEVLAVCPAEDVTEILAWHDNCVERLRAGGEPIPGDLMRFSQPGADIDTTFTEPEKPGPGSGPHGGRPLKITNPRKTKWDELWPELPALE